MIYFDHNASSPPTREHYRKVLSILAYSDANPSSIHKAGRRAKLALEEARLSVAKTLGAKEKNIIFLSGASEANNLVLYSHKQAALKERRRPYVIGTLLDHPSLKVPLSSSVFELKLLPLTEEGQVKRENLEEALSYKTPEFISFTYVNGETGLITPVTKLAELIKSRHPNCHIHVDAVQALGKIDMSEFHSSSVDSASFSAHKLGGLKGIGCLYLKEPAKKKITPMALGGSHEDSIRAGTENLIGAISFGEAVKEITPKFYEEKTKPLKEKILSFVEKHNDHFDVNLPSHLTTTGTISLYLKKTSMEKALLHFERRDIMLSTKSACSSGISGPSETLLALGCDEHRASHSLRISLSPRNTLEEVETFLKALKELI